MKRLLALLLVCLGADLRAGTFHCTWNFSDFTTGSLGVSQVQVQPIAPYGVNSNTFLTGDLLVKQTGTNTSLTISNLVNGRSYRVKFFGLTRPYGTNWVTTLTNNFDTNVTGLVNAVDYLAAPLQVDAATVAYSQVAADARFLRTNITQYVLSGTNVSFVTNGNTVTISSTASGSGSGSATNVFFIGATGETTWDQVGGSNRVSIVNVDGAKVTGSSLTNIPSLWVASIAALTNLPNVSDGVVGYVDSYFGTNVWGGGKFKRSTGSSATINNGTVFAASGSGRWLRVDTGYPTNVFLMDWFGVVPNAAINQYTGIQAAMNATPSTAGACITPPYGIATATTLTWTNRRGCYFGALGDFKTRTSGYRNYPNPLSVIHWMGVNGGTNMVVYDVGHCTFAGFGLNTRIGLNNGDQYTNAAGLLMDVDMTSTHTTTTTANTFEGIYFQERHTNSALVGLRIAESNWQNCEFFQFDNCYWQGSGADIPNYWISTTNVGGAKAIQLGGGGGGQNSFNHQMRNCGFNTWQYFIYSAGGGWDITENYGTAAGAAAYYLDGDNPSYIRSTRDEGDRQFVVSPSTKPVTIIANHIAGVTGMAVPNIPPVDAVNLIALGNDFQHEENVPSITNSVNATGWYFGSQNSFDTTNDAQIASWRFGASFKSFGDFGTLNANNNIQSGPWKTPSSSQTTNLVYQSFTDSATFPTLTLMPSNGAVAIGGNIANVIAPIWNSDPLNRTSWQIGDAYKNSRARVLPTSSGNGTQAEFNGNTSTYLIVQTTNARVDIISGNANNTLNFRSGYGQITGTSDIQLMRFDVDGQIWFPYASNLNIGSSRIGMTSAAITNHLSIYTNNALASLSATPMRYGQIALANSNATLVAVAATTSGSLAWGSTNVIPTTAAQVVNKFTGTPTGSLFLRDDGTLAAPSVGGVAWGAISGTLSSQTDLQTALDAKAALAEANQFTKTNAFDALRVTNLLQGASTAIVGWNATSKAFTTQSVSVAGSQITLSGTDGKLLYNNAGGVDFADWDTVNNQGGTLTTNNNTLLGGSFVLTGDGARGVTNLSVGAGLTVENGVLKTNGETTGGGGGSQTPWTSDINAANYKLTNLNYASFSGGVVLDKDGARNNGYVGSVVTAIGGRSNLVQGSASSVDNVVLEGRSNVFNIQSSVAVGNAIIAGSSNLLNNPALATVRNSVILGGHGNNIQGASDALAAGSGSVVQSGHNGTFVLSDSQNTATLSQSSDTLLLRFQNGVGINTNNPGTNALFVLGSQTVSSNLSVGGNITGNGATLSNIVDYVCRVGFQNVSGTNRSLVFIGDSLTAGSGATFGYPYYFTNLYASGLNYQWGTNAGVTGMKLSTMLANYTNVAQPWIVNSNAYVMLWAGINDIGVGSNAVQVLRDMSNYCRLVHQDGGIVVVGTPTKAISVTPAQQVEINKLAGLISQQNWWDYLLDTANSLPSPPNATLYNADGVHLLDAGYSWIAQCLSEVLQQPIRAKHSTPIFPPTSAFTDGYISSGASGISSAFSTKIQSTYPMIFQTNSSGSEIAWFGPLSDTYPFYFRPAGGVLTAADLKWQLTATNVLLNTNAAISGNLSATNGFYRQYIAKTANFTLTIVNDVVKYDGATLTATLPSAATVTAGKTFTIKNMNASPLTIATTNSETIDGTTPVALTTGQSRTYISDGANWFIIGGYL